MTAPYENASFGLDRSGAARNAERAQHLLKTRRKVSLTGARRIGIEQIMNDLSARPIEVTKRGSSLGLLVSAEHWQSINEATLDMNAGALRLMAEMVDRLNHDELMNLAAIVARLLGVADSEGLDDGHV